MTDKQIIIDGIDVSGCKYYDDLDCYAERDNCGYPLDCKDSPNCYYKQLKHKEQECQQAMDNYVQLDLQRVKEYNELVDLYKAKTQECEELKEQLIKCDNNIIVDCEYSKKDLCSFIHRKKEVINGLQQQLDQLEAENEELKKKVYKYEQAEKYPAAFLWQEGLL